MTATQGGTDATAPAPSTMCAAFQATVARIPDSIALRTVGGGTTITWDGYAARVRDIAAGLAALGVGPRDTVALLLTNRPEFQLVDTAVQHLGAVPFSCYYSAAPDQIGHLLTASGARFAVTERRLAPLLHGRRLEHLIVVDGQGAADGITLDEVAAAGDPAFDLATAAAAVRPGDVLTLVYTSGTTGEPKGVEITHANMTAMCATSAAALGMHSGDRLISFLPSAHIADRWASLYLHSWCGTEMTTLADPREIVPALLDVRPTLFGAVPQVWHRIAAGLRRVSAAVEDPAAARAQLGLDQVRLAITSAAPAPPALVAYLIDRGLPLTEGWGMSELSGLATLNPPGAVRPGTVGVPLPGVETRLAADGELLVRGPIVMRGYRDRPDETRAVLDADGWLHTGDLATVDADGYLSIVDRKKELIVTAGGENVAPAQVELAVRTHCPVVAHAVVAGDGRPYLVALLVLDPEAAAGKDPAQLREAVSAGIDAANARLSKAEQIRAYEIIAEPWPPGGELVTPTLKVRRRPALRAYAKHVEALYGADSASRAGA